MSEWICVVCSRVFDHDALENAVQITSDHGRGRSRTQTYRFVTDGSFHHLKKVKPKQPPHLPASESKDAELLQEVIETLAALPTPPVPEPELKPEQLLQVTPEIEEDKPLTAMEIAWNRRK